MHIEHSRRLDISLRDSEIDTLRAVLTLAHTLLRNSPEVQLHGSPLVRQAGLCGPELHDVKEMLQRLGHGLDIELPAEAGPLPGYPIALRR